MDRQQSRAPADARAMTAHEALELEVAWLAVVLEAQEQRDAWIRDNEGLGFAAKLAGEPGRLLALDLCRREAEFAARWASEHGSSFEEVWERLKALRRRLAVASPFQEVDDVRQRLIRERELRAWHDLLMREGAVLRRPVHARATAPAATPHRARAKRSRPQRRRSRAPGDDDPDGGPGERAARSPRRGWAR